MLFWPEFQILSEFLKNFNVRRSWKRQRSLLVPFTSFLFFFLWTLMAKPSHKIESVNKAFLFWYWQWLKNFFFRNKTFLFIKIESWTLASVWKVIAWNLTNFNSIKQPIENNNFLNELKFFEVSQNSISDRCRKFQLSILKNKKVLFLKIIFFRR